MNFSPEDVKNINEVLEQLKNGTAVLNQCDVDAFPPMSDTERAESVQYYQKFFNTEITSDETYPAKGH